MGARNELVEVVLRELECFGITGEVVHRGKHIEVVWFVAGQRRSNIVSASASDHRAWLNARGEVRRTLRADNVQPAPRDNVLSFKNAISVPKPVELPLERIKKLEEEVTILLDWLVDERARADALEVKLKNVKVTISFDAPAPVPVLVKPSIKTAGDGGPSDRILVALAHGKWVAKQALQKETGIEDRNLSATLNYLKNKKGLIENGQRGYWRKKPEQQVATG